MHPAETQVLQETRDVALQDLFQMKFRLADGVICWPERSHGNLTYRIERVEQDRFYRVGYAEYVFLSLLDGKTTAAAASGRTAALLGQEAPPTARATALIQWLLREELICPANKRPERRVGAAAGASTKARNQPSLWQSLNPFWMRIPLVRPGKSAAVFHHLLHQMCQLLGGMFSQVGFFAWGIILTLAAVALTLDFQRFLDQTGQVFSVGGGILLIGVWATLKVLHELGHALACRKFGGRVSEAGVILVLFSPLAYVDVSSSWRMTRSRRVVISLAGMMVELWVAAVALLVWYFVDPGTSPMLSSVLHGVVLSAGVTTILFNANPLMRFDGYYVLADTVDIPNLQSHALEALQEFAVRLIYGRRSRKQQRLRSKRQAFALIVFGAACLVWRMIICVGLVIAAGAFFHGAGIVLSIVGVILWMGIPLVQAIRYHLRMACENLVAMLRGSIAMTTLAGLLGVIVFVFPIPTSISAPAVLLENEDAEVRAGVDGFVYQVHVSRGQQVRHGEPLLTLQNNALEVSLRREELKLEQIELRIRRATGANDVAATRREQEQRLATITRIEQLRQRDEARIVRATTNGVATIGHWDRLPGKYVREGELLLQIQRQTDRQAIAVLPPADIQQLAVSIGQPIALRDPHGRLLQSTVAHVEPTATVQPPHPALIATNGGALAVRTVSEEQRQQENGEEYQLLTPHFRVVLDLSAQNALPRAGTRATAIFGRKTATLWERYFDRWIP